MSNDFLPIEHWAEYVPLALMIVVALLAFYVWITADYDYKDEEKNDEVEEMTNCEICKEPASGFYVLWEYQPELGFSVTISGLDLCDNCKEKHGYE